MNEYVDELLLRYKKKGVLIDTNLFLMLLVGSYEPKLLGEKGFKRLVNYSVSDFQLLLKLLKWFEVAVTTPHILTEVSNLAGQLPEHDKVPCFRLFGQTFSAIRELHAESLVEAKEPHFPVFGLTDSVIWSRANEFLIITDDLRLHNRLEKDGRSSLNFNHIRTLSW